MRVPRTFVFVDLSGFTNYTAAFGDDAARVALLKLFDMLGGDPMVTRYRARMFNLLH